MKSQLAVELPLSQRGSPQQEGLSLASGHSEEQSPVSGARSSLPVRQGSLRLIPPFPCAQRTASLWLCWPVPRPGCVSWCDIPVPSLCHPWWLVGPGGGALQVLEPARFWLLSPTSRGSAARFNVCTEHWTASAPQFCCHGLKGIIRTRMIKIQSSAFLYSNLSLHK